MPPLKATYYAQSKYKSYLNIEFSSGLDTSIMVLWFFVWNIDELSIRQNIVAKKLSKADKNWITNIKTFQSLDTDITMHWSSLSLH